MYFKCIGAIQKKNEERGAEIVSEDWKGQDVWEKENKEGKAGKEGRNRNQHLFIEEKRKEVWKEGRHERMKKERKREKAIMQAK